MISNARSKRGMTRKIVETVKKSVCESGVQKVIVGVSGGADSTAVLLALAACNTPMIAVHCNFHLRGEESMRDQRFVEEFCASNNIELRIVDFDVEKYRRKNNMSVEMACRELRYAEFRKLMTQTKADRIVVAHNADDNIETLFLNLFRGAGVKGLKGMLPDTGEILRPLLKCGRKEIEEYLSEKGVGYVTDSTNLESDYRRNFIRNEVLPLIESRWLGVRKAIQKSIENLRVEHNALEKIGEKLLMDEDFLSLEAIGKAPDSFWIIYKFASSHGATRDVAIEIHDVYLKRAGSQTIVGKRWKSGCGTLKFTMKGLKFEK